jgi:uncharacterized membrane protein
VRVVLSTPSFTELTALAYDEIRRYGADSPQIPRRMFACFEVLARELPAARRPVIDQRRELLTAAVAGAWADAAERDLALAADRRGLG